MSDVNLQEYLATGEVPSDPAVLEELLKQMEGAESEGTVEVEQVVAEEPAQVATDQDKTEETADSTKEAEGILSANGKHVLPYDVLKQERAEKAALKAELEAARKAVEDLRNGGAVGKQSLAEFTGMTEEELAELQEYFPDQYDGFVAALQKANEAEAKLSQYEAAERQRQEQINREIAMTVQEHIDNNPLLREFQKDPAKWEVCKNIDNSLRNDPETASLTMQERFERVAKSVAQLYGIKTESEAPKPEVKKAEVAKPKVNSLSDLPAGSSPEASELEKLEDMSAAELGAMFLKMTPDQQVQYLNNL